MVNEKKPRTVRLRSVHDINRMLARTINQLVRSEIEESKAGKVGYLCNIMIRSFEVCDIEKRLVELEDQVERANNR